MTPTSPLRPRLIDLPTIVDERGSLTFSEEGKPLPFPLKRLYIVHKIPPGIERGGHAHRRAHELIVAASGRFSVHLQSPDRKVISFVLDHPAVGLYVPPNWWRMMDSFLPDSLCLVLASELFDEADYIRDPDEFFQSSRRNHD